MGAIEVKPVVTRRDRKQFVQLPWQLYRDDPNWVPPLRTAQLEILNYKPHPFYRRNRIQTFVASDGSQVIGRIAAILNQDHLDRYSDARGFFGFYEAVDRQDVADALLGAARQWLGEHGVTELRGPVNPSMNYECGMLVDGFGVPPTFMMTYNPPYYAQQMEAAGLHKTQDLYAFYARLEMREQMDQKLRYLYREVMRRFDVKLRTLDTRRFLEEVRQFLDLYNKSMPGTWGFVPMSDAEIAHLAKGLQRLIVPELTTVAEIDGKVVGATFGLLDFNPRVKRIDGRLFPFGFLHLLRNKTAIKKMRLIATNVLPEYQMWGLGLVLAGRLLPVGLEMGITECELSWVLESNHLSCKTIQRGGASLEKTYRIYDTEAPK